MVLNQAKLANKAKLDAIVCSAREVKIVKKVFKKEIITPGIRFKSKKNDSQLIIRNPDSTRPWQHVLDPLYGYMLLAYNLYKDGKKYQGPWNFGPLNNSNKSVKELVEELRKAVRGQLEVIKTLKDENESLWFMLEEIKNSDMENWAKQNNNKEILQNRLDNWFAEMATMKNNQGDA